MTWSLFSDCNVLFMCAHHLVTVTAHVCHSEKAYCYG